MLQFMHFALSYLASMIAIYPCTYNPNVTVGCGTLAVVFAAAFAVIFPLVGPAVVLLLFLMLVGRSTTFFMRNKLTDL